jgi:thiol-disulfide isomerase/thioredoxin
MKCNALSLWKCLSLYVAVLVGCDQMAAPPAVAPTANSATSAASPSAEATNGTLTTTSGETNGQAAGQTVPAEPAVVPVDLHKQGYAGFPQIQATVLCDTPMLRVSVCSDETYLYVQAILWDDDDDSAAKSDDGRVIGDWSQLVLDLDADQKNTPQVDRSYALNPWPNLPGLRYTVVVSENGTTGLLPDSKGRGAIEYVEDASGKRSRVDSFLIPLNEIKRQQGDEIRLAYWGSSVLPKFTVNSIGFESPSPYYSFALPHDTFQSLKLASIEGKIDPSQVADPRSEQTSEPQEVVSHPPVGEAPPEVVAADWLNTDTPQSLSALKGKVVLVEFWATWCGPCVAGIPHLNELQSEYRETGLQILSFTNEDRETVEKFQKKAKAPIEYTVGLGSPLFKEYGVTGIPHAFVVGRDGKLVWYGHPASPECESKIAEALKQD